MSENKDLLIDHDFDGIKELNNDMPSWWKWLFYISIVVAVVYMLYYHVFNLGDLSYAEYQKELNPNWQPPAQKAALVYYSPYYSAYETLSPRQMLEKLLAEQKRKAEQLAAGETGAPSGVAAENLSFEELLAAAMRKATPENQIKLKQAFPEIWASMEKTATAPATATVTAAGPKLNALTDAANLEKGKAIFQTNCVSCHGKAGEGGIGPNFTDDYWIHGAGMNNVVNTIINGVPAKGMISWKTSLKQNEILQVASFILTLHGTNPPNPKKPQGDKVEYPLKD